MSRETPPPVADNNPPSRRRPPPEPTTAVAQQTPPPVAPSVATNVGTNVGSTVPNGRGGPPMAQALDALMYGRVDPEQDRGQTGVRLPRYVTDAVRVLSATSRGRLSMQDVVTEAVKAYLPHDVLYAAWLRHGGEPEQQGGEQ
jgi:hypothetical protein